MFYYGLNGQNKHLINCAAGEKRSNNLCIQYNFFIVFFFYWTFCSKSHLTKVLRRKTKETQKTLFTVMTCLHLTRRCRLDHEHWAVLSIYSIYSRRILHQVSYSQQSIAPTVNTKHTRSYKTVTLLLPLHRALQSSSVSLWLGWTLVLLV